jgi:hypothetical protein
MTTNEELKDLMASVPLTQSKVAEYTVSSIEAVKGWCSAIDATRYRNMPPSKLKLLKFELINR